MLDRDAGRHHEVRARYTVVADGANSRFGRALGTSRDRHYPIGMALRGYFRSPRHDEPFIESHLDIRDASGDGRAGLRLGVPPRRRAGERGRRPPLGRRPLEGGQHDPADGRLHRLGSRAPGNCPPRPCADHRRAGSCPWALSVRPRIGPNVLAIGDAAGSINPFNGEGIAYGYETGRLAAACVARALSGEGVHALVDYESQLQAAYGLYLPDGPGVRPAHQQARPDAGLRAQRHALPQRHGVAPAHHGQPGASRRDRSGRGCLPGARRPSAA